ncbi:MAG: tRNA uridine-5-carboxymethylaminomethyl(34) synthesis GTPase MnmE [Acidobacteria bacterium]|uniref:tRNA modification GTPase MnmE n=1 Tax=Candidatus Polarisedimenticola svalbardensis TaxID=2886004 RepID=A0A8J6XTD5_9BACT|nr:tRNA uridine-5-carboxymethylaminomethyl(34) synthesis GTPase MnmE [Candidatus Polarisedimenticola svalbardensis]
MHDLDLTVVAVATPPGRGGVGCIRLSGPDAFSISDDLFRSSSPGHPVGRTTFGRFLDRDGQVVDHGYRVLFREGASFTGEPVAELWTHGSPPVLSALLEAAAERGAMPAEPGEFTYRAMVHGRIDLARAEAIRDLVDATTRYQAKLAHAQAEGSLSRTLAPLEEGLSDLIVRTEAAVEFEDEAETDLKEGVLTRSLSGLQEACDRLIAGFNTGRVFREGASLVITGLPNTGKSSLFNRLLVRDRAIVTDTPGTTRDTLEETIDLDGVPVRLTDTAGLRDGAGAVESEGVRRAVEARDRADLVLLVMDRSRPLTPSEKIGVEEAAAAPDRTIVVLNKIDLPAESGAPDPEAGAVPVSALTGEGCNRLKTVIREKLVGPAGSFEDPLVTNVRHAEALVKTGQALSRAAEATAAGIPEDLVLEDLREAMQQLGSITGEFTTEDLFDRIFSTFCIGK